jgi:hypothetical protein
MKRLLHSILSRRRANAISAARDAARCVAGPNREFRGVADYRTRNLPGRRIHRWHVVNLAHGGGGRWRSANLRRAGSDWIEGALPAPDAGAMLGREDYNTNGAGAESAGIYNAVRNVRPRGPRAAGPA